MPQVSVSVGGRSYRIACGEGEEEHLAKLAGTLDGRITALRSAFGEIGDQRMTVMAAITLADELSEAHRRLATLEGQIAALAAARLEDDDRNRALGEVMAAALDQVTDAVEEVTTRLSGPRVG